MLITGRKWAAPLLYGLGKSSKVAQKWGWKLLLRWGLSESVCAIYKELYLSELPLRTKGSPLHPPECSWLGNSLGDYTIQNFSFFLNVSRRREQRGEGSTVILPKWSIAVEFGVLVRSSFWKAGWFFKCFAWQSSLVPQKICVFSPLPQCPEEMPECPCEILSTGWFFSSAGFLFHRQGTLWGLIVSLFSFSAFLWEL